MRNEDNKQCEGCNLKYSCYLKVILNIPTDICPCMNCLVKVMCSKRCRERRDKFNEHNHQ